MGLWRSEVGADISAIVQMNKNSIDHNFTIPENYNALSVGEIDINAEINIEGQWEII